MIPPWTDKAVYCRVHQVLFFDAGTTEFTTDERCQMALSSPVILVIADISGYTHFMRMHSVVSSHAREITVRLLKSVIDWSAYPLKVAEIEGDAVFFYASLKNGGSVESIESVKRQIIGLFRAFRAEAARLEAMDVCSCEACSSVASLVLKQVVHLGEATIEKVSRFEKLFSLDVILVHRLLKNSVEGRRYVLLTAPANDVFEPFFGLIPESRYEEVEGIGSIEAFVFHGAPLDKLIESERTLNDRPPHRLADRSGDLRFCYRAVTAADQIAVTLFWRDEGTLGYPGSEIRRQIGAAKPFRAVST